MDNIFTKKNESNTYTELVERGTIKSAVFLKNIIMVTSNAVGTAASESWVTRVKNDTYVWQCEQKHSRVS